MEKKNKKNTKAKININNKNIINIIKTVRKQRAKSKSEGASGFSGHIPIAIPNVTNTSALYQALSEGNKLHDLEAKVLNDVMHNQRILRDIKERTKHQEEFISDIFPDMQIPISPIKKVKEEHSEAEEVINDIINNKEQGNYEMLSKLNIKNLKKS